MKQEQRILVFDEDIQIEAYHFQGVMQKFPNHFHEHYVVGYIKSGKRAMNCRNSDYVIGAGDLLFINPYDNHSCWQVDQNALDFKALNILPDIMKQLTYEVIGKELLLSFGTCVVNQSDIVLMIERLHTLIMSREQSLLKEETLVLLIKRLLEYHTDELIPELKSGHEKEIELACEFMKENYNKNITLDEISRQAGFSKYYLIRIFANLKGITPAQYQKTLRINEAQKLIRQGMPLMEVALLTGFSDQSHFTNVFKSLIGITPRQYGLIS